MFDRSEVAAACKRWGPKLHVPDGIDPVRLLWALAGNESSFGRNCKPRHEAYYHDLTASGKNTQLNQLTKQFGCAAHCSFGPWQLLLVNASAGTRPEDFENLDRAAVETVVFINVRILAHEHATTVEQIADAYNSGDWRDRCSTSVQKYVQDCKKYYDAGDLLLLDV